MEVKLIKKTLVDATPEEVAKSSASVKEDDVGNVEVTDSQADSECKKTRRGLLFSSWSPSPERRSLSSDVPITTTIKIKYEVVIRDPSNFEYVKTAMTIAADQGSASPLLKSLFAALEEAGLDGIVDESTAGVTRPTVTRDLPPKEETKDEGKAFGLSMEMLIVCVIAFVLVMKIVGGFVSKHRSNHLHRIEALIHSSAHKQVMPMEDSQPMGDSQPAGAETGGATSSQVVPPVEDPEVPGVVPGVPEPEAGASP
jgi:hypothetical protein